MFLGKLQLWNLQKPLFKFVYHKHFLCYVVFFWARTLLSQFVVVSNKSEFFYIGEYKSLYLFTLQIVFLKPTDFRIHFQSICFFLLLMSIQQPPFLYLPACTSASGGSLEGVTACNLFNSLCIPINRLELLPWREKKNKYWRMSLMPSKVRFWTARWQSRVCYRKHPPLAKPNGSTTHCQK